MRRAFFAAGAVLVTACSLFVNLDGLSTNDAGTPDAADVSVVDASPDNVMMMPDTHVPACPSGKGQPMIAFDGHCIDAYEVTFQQYLAFVADIGDAGAKVPPECAFKTSFTPGGTLPMNLALPVLEVDWCDAYAYCAWAGKRLCGGMDGKGIPTADFKDPTKSEWMSACSMKGAHAFPYGDTFDPGACNTGDDAGGGAIAQGGMFPKCVGGYPGLFDMVGNAKEWVAECNGDAGATDRCRRRGGGFNNSADPGSNCAFDEEWDRNYRYPSGGIRCCAFPQ